LDFGFTEVSDISSLENLTDLEKLRFYHNKVADLSPLLENDGFGPGDEINMMFNYLDLSPGSEDMKNINVLIDRGVDVKYESQK
jgi:Leucine-rich repeat (LRR) protein